MKKKDPWFLLLLLSGCFLLAPFLSNAVDIWVAPNGSDKNEGTKEKPLASLHLALRKVRELRRLNDASVKNGAHIILRGGIYQLDEPLFIRPEDSGTEESPTVIEAAPGEQPILSGGVSITGWKKLTANGAGIAASAKAKLWEADAPTISGLTQNFRQLYINGEKAIRAKDRNGDSMNRILSWNHQTETCWIPWPKALGTTVPEGMELFIHQWWAIAILRIKSAEIKGDSARLHFYQPENRVQSEHPWPAPWISNETGNSAFFLMNALPLLDSPGEWYLDAKRGKIYYWPRNGENMLSAQVVASSLETLLKIEGTIDHPVSYFTVKGLSFQHAGWLRPSQAGHVPHQVGMYMLDAYKLKKPGTADKATLENQAWVGRPAAAVEVSYAENSKVENCRFEHLASTAVDYHRGVHNSSIQGNIFKDIGGSAIVAGVFSEESSEVHLPYKPEDERVVTKNIEINNNLINNVANEDWGCVGIAAGYVQQCRIEHNDISELPYMGISLGWGWTTTLTALQNNKVTANKIHRFAREMYDVAGIYTLSAQPGTIVTENYIDSAYKAPYAHLPSHWFYLYTDEGSSFMTVKDNWTPSQKFLQNANGPGNTWSNNGPVVADSIKYAAGLEKGYQSLLDEKKILNKEWAINHEQPVVVELITAANQSIDLPKLKSVLANYGVDSTAVYQWQNHYVIFDKVQDVSVLRSKIQNALPGIETKVYYDAFYEFNRQHCADKQTAKEWEHVILTANLVADAKMQQEYLNYHATQFRQWPEVANGFCNADFQQLLVYKNGRQLMLVISIPKGKTLDELNPKTTENNPRVDEWNKLMKKYQEGIPGTKAGEVWVFLKRITQ